MIDIEEKEPKVFDQEPKEITIEDAKSYYNAKYLNDRDVYDTDSLATTEAGIVQFVGSLKKLPSQLRMAGGQAMYATGEQMVQNEETREGIRAKLLPQGSMIFNGNLGVKVGEQLKESGKYNIITANRNLETLNREIENEMPNLSEEDRKSWGLMIAQQGLDYGTMLGLSLIHPVLGMGYMGTKIYGQETEEGAEAYKRKFGTIEGFEELSGDELRLNIANTAVQEIIEKAFGAPAQIKSFKAMKDFGKAFFTGFGEEFITENLQNASDAVFDHIGKRLQEDETIWTQITDNFKGTLVAGMFGGTAGTAFAIHNRSQGIQNFEKLLDGSDVAPEDRNALATDLYNAGVNNLQGIITKELELNSQLRAKHGEVYDTLKTQIDKQARAVGAYEGKTEAEIAQYLESTAKREADHVLAEAQLRNTLIDDVMNSTDIVFENGRLYLKGLTEEQKKVKERKRKKKSQEEVKPQEEELKTQIETNATAEEKEQNLNDVVSSYDGAENFDVESMSTDEKQAVFEAEQQVKDAFVPTAEETIEREDGELFGKNVDLGEEKASIEQDRQELAEKIKQEWKDSEDADTDSNFNWRKLSENEEEYARLYGEGELARLSDEYEEEQYETRKDKERTEKYNEWKQKQAELSPETNEAIQEDTLPEVEKEDTVSKDKIGDFGEYLYGAKKDLWKSYKDKISKDLPEDAEDIKLSEYFPEPNYEKAIAGGADVNMLATIKALRDYIPTKPKRLYRLKKWGEKVMLCRAIANQILDGKFDLEAVDTLIPDALKNQVQLYRMLGYPYFTKAKGYTLEPAYYHYYGGSNWVLTNIYHEGDRKGYKVEYNNNYVRINGSAFIENINDAIDEIKSRIDLDSSQGSPRSQKVKFDIYYKTDDSDKIIVGKKIRSGKYVDLHTFGTIKEAREYLANNYDSLVAELEKLKQNPMTRREVNEARIGEDYRKGSDVSPEMFADTFGFRGVQFGNWVEQKTRINDLNEAYDALVDLSKVLNVPTRALSLNGTLGLAFGARGHKGAMAHYEPDKIVINLTKMQGAGSLAHEWFHALDNSFMKRENKELGFITEMAEENNPLMHNRPEVMLAFINLRKKLENSKMYERSREWDKAKTKDYWSTVIEMGARTFEQYVGDKLSEKNVSNDFLVNLYPMDRADNVYLNEDEKAEIYEAYDKLFNTLKTRETEKGVGFYQESLDIAEENAQLDEMYPAYEGETITINGQEKTVYNSNGDRIAKSKEALENFYKWFGDSKVVDEQGRPLVVYHGTKDVFSVFSADKGSKYDSGYAGSGFYFTSEEGVAKDYAEWKKGEGSAVVMPVYLNIHNPLTVDSQGKGIKTAVQESLGIKVDESPFGITKETSEKISNKAKEKGYDGISYKSVGGDVVYVAFEPNQIKSTSNRGTYSESENIYYQAAGPKALTAALDELDRAKQLDADGVGNEEIRQQTGWYKGADGKWRFEISDKNAKIKESGLQELNKGNSVRLEDILDHKDLYKAYPSLANIEVKIDESLTGTSTGAYVNGASAEDMTIYVRRGEGEESFRKILLHEIQHDIQTIEGFARGGNTSTVSNDFLEKRNEKIQSERDAFWENKAKELLGKDAKEYLAVRKNSSVYSKKMGDADEKLGKLRREYYWENNTKKRQKLEERINKLEAKSKEYSREFYKYSNMLAGKYYETEEKIYDALKKETNKNPQRYKILDKYMGGLEGYRRLYGEVEARNAEKRADMTDEQRRAESPESTQDVANADAIVVFDDGTAMAYEPETYYQSAFAGSRVDYDRPSLEAIGSGEGNQAHGWGLYYALNRDVAERYRKRFVGEFTYQGMKFDNPIERQKILFEQINKQGKDAVLKSYEKQLDDLREQSKKSERTEYALKDSIARLEYDVEWIKDIDEKDLQFGQTHEVDIPENPYLLDEQKTFAEQSDFVKQQLMTVWDNLVIDDAEIVNLTGSKTNPYKNVARHKTGEEIYEDLANILGSGKKASELLERHGIKGITYYGELDGRCFVIFNPADVKVIQKFYQRKKGKIKGAFDKLTKSIKITKDADFSTYQHEFAHFWLDNIWDYVNSGKASEEYVKRFNELKKWLGVKPNQDYFTREQHEKFARGYEKFLYEGKSVNPIIADTFDDYEKFIREVYDDITEIDTRAGKEYEPLSREAYNFFNSMVSGELTPPANLPDETVEQARETVAKSETDAEEVVAEETKTLEENRADYSLTPVKTDTKTGYLTAYEKMTGEKVESGVAELDKEMAKAREFVENNPDIAERVVNGEMPTPDNMLKNTIYLAYQEQQKKLGNTDKRVNALLKQAQELRAYGQEIASQKLAYADQSTPLYWMSRVMSARAEAIAEGNKMTVSELQDFINKEIRPAIGDEKAVENVVKKLKDELGIKELYQAEKVDLNTRDGVYKYVTSKLGITPTQEQAMEITKRADDMLTNLNNAQVNGNPSVDYFVKYKDLENYANSIAPSSNLRVLVSVVGKGNLLASFKSPLTNVVANAPVAGLQAALRRQHLGVMKSVVDPELIKQNKQTSWEIYRKTGYQLNNMTDVSPKGMTLGERITQSQGEGAIRKVGRIYENLIYKWSLGAPDLLFKDFAFNDYVSLAATKESGGDVAKANEIYKDAVKILPETELGQRIRQEAIEDSLISTYQNNGKISESALKIRKSMDFGVGFGEFIAPFVKTPANVVGMGLDTAFGGVRALASEIIRDVRAGKVLTPKSENIRLVVQNGLGLLVASLLLGAIDDDDYMPSYSLATNKDKQLAKELNIPFNSIRIGDTWYSMDYLGPLASPLMGLLQARREHGIVNSVMGYVKSGAIQTLSIPAFGNIGDLTDNITNIVRKDGVDALQGVASDVIEATVARSVPSIVSDIAKVLDENDREAKTLKERLMAKVPLVREELPEKYNVTTGRVEPRAENTMKRVLQDLFAGSRVKEQVVNDVADELFRLNGEGYGVSLTDVTRSGLLSAVDSDKKALIKKDFAKLYSKGVKDLIGTYKYRNADDEDKRDMIDSLRRKYVNELKKKYLKKNKR